METHTFTYEEMSGILSEYRRQSNPLVSSFNATMIQKWFEIRFEGCQLLEVTSVDQKWHYTVQAPDIMSFKLTHL